MEVILALNFWRISLSMASPAWRPAALYPFLSRETVRSPNDSRRIPPTAENPLGCAYEDAAGVTDTAAQVRTLQRQGVRVSAVFMGEDSSAGAATQIYGKNMARIRGMDQLARAAGRLIQNEIRELGD